MNVVRKIRNVIRGILQAHGTANIKRRIWNSEFKSGRWKCLDTSPGDSVYAFVERYAIGGSILDLGCGSGNTGLELSAADYGEYMGVDISDVAIESSRKRSIQGGRGDKNQYRHADIVAYVPDRMYDVILLRDSIYYIPYAQIVPTITRYVEYLAEAGVFVVRMYSSSGKYQAITNSIENHFSILERHVDDRSGALVLVFRPQARMRLST